MTEVVAQVPDHHGHAPGYLQGASAEAAAQKLIDGGLFADPKSAATAAPASPREESAPQTQPVTQAAPTEAQTTEPEESFQSLEDFLTKQGLQRESFLSLPAKAKVDGKELDVPLAKLIESYQISEHLAHKSNAFAEERRTWDTERTQTRTALSQQLQLAQQLGILAQNELMREYQGVTPDDPARYLAAQQRLGAIHNWLGQVNQSQSQLSATALAAEQQRMLDAVPEWRDTTKFQEASKQLSSYAASRGFAPAELSGIADHRYMLVLHDAARARDLQAQVDTLTAQLEGKKAAALKLVRTAAPMASPGARTTQSPQTSRLAAARTAMSSGKMRSLDSQAAVAQALLDAGVA